MFAARALVTLRIGDRDGTVYVSAPGGVNASTDVGVTGSGPPPFD
jgi:hypothetical protein